MKTKIRVGILLTMMLAMCLLSGGESKYMAYADGGTEYYVNAAWEGMSGNVTVDGMELTIGTNAFATIQEAIAKIAGE